MTTDTPSELRARSLVLGYDGPEIVHGIDAAIVPGSFTAILGPNGCGKSTLLSALAGLLAPREGAVLLDGKALSEWKPKAAARRIGLLPQRSSAPEGITVTSLVRRGRYPHQGFLQPWSDADTEAVERAMVRTGLDGLRDAEVGALSGGQQQRVWVAMALAQDTGVLLLDEPTTYLDIAYQLDLLDLFADLHAGGTTIVAVLHDLNQAARYATHVVAMREGEIVAEGPAGEVITAANVARVYGVDASIVPDPRTGDPVVIAHGRTGRGGEAPAHS